MATHGRGLICLPLTAERCDALRLPLMSERNTSNFGTAFCESIDAREGVTTGISAADRTLTILKGHRPDCRPRTWPAPATSSPSAPAMAACWCAPGRPKPRWIWRAWPDSTAGVICEIMNDDGTMARVPQLEEFCAATA
jgi:3,4-dihydroxy 2-butanone 4-phosphate synthase / GTP cyclohydrolase II